MGPWQKTAAQEAVLLGERGGSGLGIFFSSRPWDAESENNDDDEVEEGDDEELNTCLRVPSFPDDFTLVCCLGSGRPGPECGHEHQPYYFFLLLFSNAHRSTLLLASSVLRNSIGNTVFKKLAKGQLKSPPPPQARQLANFLYCRFSLR